MAGGFDKPAELRAFGPGQHPAGARMNNPGFTGLHALAVGLAVHQGGAGLIPNENENRPGLIGIHGVPSRRLRASGR